MSLDAIGIVSSQTDKSINFYKILGLKFQEVGGTDHFEAQGPSGIRVMLDSEELMKNLNPSWTSPQGSGVVLCFKQASSTDVDSIFQKLIEFGAQIVKEPWDAFWGQRYASVQDPDGNQIDLFADIS